MSQCRASFMSNSTATMTNHPVQSDASSIMACSGAEFDGDIREREEGDTRIRFCVTGSAAHSRLVPLLPPSWADHSPYASAVAVASSARNLDFLWENAPRHETKELRDHVKVYSHLPNGTKILDCKWVLARLLANAAGTNLVGTDNPLLAVLKTHCFKGRSGFQDLCHTLGLLEPHEARSCGEESTTALRFRDLVESYDFVNAKDGPFPEAPSLWVVKDAMANGAGGIWFVGPENAAAMMNAATSPFIEGHHYVAQEYAWPPVLFQGRKCHVRVYGCMASDGRVFCHERCFLHVANQDFTVAANVNDDNGSGGDIVFDESVHITNCCANSHDPAKFAGEICASLTADDWSYTDSASGDRQPVVPLRQFAPSIHASIQALAERTFPFLQGGQVNNGFEYLGMDFILAYASDNTPVAFMLEVNAPPSQDTATGLPHAEDLHDTVLSDWVSLWVLPKITGAPEIAGGWQCVYHDTQQRQLNTDLFPSKAALVNKIRWTIFERKAAKESLLAEPAFPIGCGWRSMEDMSIAVRKLFPFFHSTDKVFLESAGGSQVPQLVIDSMVNSLSNRHRARVGSQSKAAASRILSLILGASPDRYLLHFGANATSLLSQLAQEYVRLGKLTPSDEIIISTENHMANVKPWVEAAEAVGATVRWWRMTPQSSQEALHRSLETLVTCRTRLVVLCHASNIIGELRDVGGLKGIVERLSGGKAEVIVDGVAAVPHVYADLDRLDVDWYVISCHKLFGPHFGVLAGRKRNVRQLDLELGTTNFEACAGIEGLGQYFLKLASLWGGEWSDPRTCKRILSRSSVEAAYGLIARVEVPLSKLMHDLLSKSTNIVLVGSTTSSGGKIPVSSFRHTSINHSTIIAACEEGGILARRGTFLSSTPFQEDYAIDGEEGVIRFSLAHYSLSSEIHRLFKILEAIPGW